MRNCFLSFSVCKIPDVMWFTGMVNLKNSYFTHDELKQALKKFKAQKDDVQHPVVLLFCFYFHFPLFLYVCVVL